MPKKLQVLIDIHAEPDNHYLYTSEKEDWDGFEKGSQLILNVKKKYPKLKMTWLFRADPQIGEVYGENSWGLARYKETIDDLMATGDEIGIHMHPYRFQEDGSQTQDYADFDHLRRCMDESVSAFENVMGYRPLVLANTVGTTSTELVNHNRSIGIKYDLSLNKDSKEDFPDHLGKYEGQRSSGTDFPGEVYCPSYADYRKKSDTPDDYRMIPIQCFELPVETNPLKNWARKNLQRLVSNKIVKPTLSEHSKSFREMINSSVKASSPYLVIDSRSDIFNYNFKMERIHRNLEFLLNHNQIDLITPKLWL